jgi:presequence protease
MTAVHGFSLLKEQQIPEIHSTARLWRHDRTGAELLSLMNEDENKVFGVALRTPPSNSTGVAHILEHSVLCGSRKYPVKEPFVELLKGSLHTFLNAFTYPDKTCYPVAGTNLKDFRNLVDVYLDAVFFPRITEQIFLQEGRHIEMNGPDDPGHFKGVVFNEMKGAYSSPDGVLGEYVQQSLFPDNCYGLDSGGNPENIPDLDYPEFKAFHTTHYHPSNARFYFYGDDPEEERLATIAACVDQFEPLRVNSAVLPQPAFTKPKRLHKTFAAGAGGDEQDRHRAMVTVNQLLPEAFDPRINLAMHMLEHILIGMPASPLRKALIESGLGEDLAGVGLEAELRQMYFSTGLKGIDPDDAGKVEEIIFRTLEELTENMPTEAVEAAINSVEFDLREHNTGSFPRGLSLMLEALTSWLHDRDPMQMLAFEAPLAAIKADIASGKPVFQEMIRKYLLDNPHRTILLLEPDETLQKQREKTEKDRLATIVGALDAKGKEELIRETEALKIMQETPDAPEALGAIPRLTLEDLDRESKTIPLDVSSIGETEILYHDLPTDGITYVDLGFDLNTLATENLPLASLFGRALLEMGTSMEDFVSLGMRIARKTGGIHPTLLISPRHDDKGTAAQLLLRAKATTDKTGEMFAILRDVLTKTIFDDKDRFLQMVLEEKAQMEHALVPVGHRIAAARLRARFTAAGRMEDSTTGIGYLMVLRELARKIEQDWPRVLETLESMRRDLIRRGNMFVNATLDQQGYTAMEPEIRAFLDAIPGGKSPVSAADDAAGAVDSQIPNREGLIIPARVNYVGKGTDIHALGYSFHGSLTVILKHMNTSWLWDRIRVRGGAYGAFCLYDRAGGVLAFVSYRDPNLAETLKTYDLSGDYLRGLKLTKDELAKSIIGAVGNMDAYQLPDAKGFTSMARHLTGETAEMRQRMRDEALATSEGDFRAFADVLDAAAGVGMISVLGDRAVLTPFAAEEGMELTEIL